MDGDHLVNTVRISYFLEIGVETVTISLTLAVKRHLLNHQKIEDINIYHISQLPKLPPKGACLLQDHWYAAGKSHQELKDMLND